MNVKKFGFWEWWCVVWAAYDIFFAVKALIANNLIDVLFNTFFAVVMVVLLLWHVHLRKVTEKRVAEHQARMDRIFGVQDKV